ncbi:hypothetical protein Nepgr_020945 [Nepenthes gracilis]|uniref:Uncharacterized protein n=1 Tax=Nepenthes gracilis TaxID=150966 RepID=A0AAD3SXU8_NEPGR|nr:hypothetical protein Nepgr_020945 [Nepenthes gracilis]
MDPWQSFQQQVLPRKTSKENLDRFIPNRSAVDFDYAHYMLTEGWKGKENPVVNSPSREAYSKQIEGGIKHEQTRILPFKNKALLSPNYSPKCFSPQQRLSP